MTCTKKDKKYYLCISIFFAHSYYYNGNSIIQPGDSVDGKLLSAHADCIHSFCPKVALQMIMPYMQVYVNVLP